MYKITKVGVRPQKEGSIGKSLDTNVQIFYL